MSKTTAAPEQARRDAPLIAVALGTSAIYLTYKLVTTHPDRTVLVAGTLLALIGAAVWIRARAKDLLATRRDPARNGLIIGTRKGDWLLAKRRPYVLTWTSFRQHILITGPTGRGKSYGFIAPILKASTTRPNTGVLYLDGKGDPIDRDIQFDHVFDPQTPYSSARWNPLSGSDPSASARSFADAIYPNASQPDAVFYEVRGAFAIRTVAPAIAYTGFGLAESPASTKPQIRAALLHAGLSEHDADHVITQKGIAACEDQLRWLPTREQQDGAALLRYITANNRPSPKIGDELLMPKSTDATIAALHEVLFTDGKLEELADRLDGHLDQDAPDIARSRFAMLAAQVRSLAAMPSKERAGVLANLENRLTVFLQPPFDRLCDTTDFTPAAACAGSSIAILLPTGSFPGIAEPLGRTALAQLQHSVLASSPDVTKVAILDEFHNFVSPAFTKFLSQARSHGGAAVMSTQTIADFHPDYRDRLLANASTQILTPGALPFDADHFSAAFGSQLTSRQSTSIQRRTLQDPNPVPTIRTEYRDTPRYTPTEISELAPGEALIRQVSGRIQYPAVIVDVERHD